MSNSSQKPISELQKDFLTASAVTLQQVANAEDLQQELYQNAKKFNIKPKDAFELYYLRMTGKKYGPKAAWFLMEHKAEAIKRFTNFDDLEKKSSTIQSTKTDLIKFSPEFVKTYPSASVGFALIEGVKIEKINIRLEQEKKEFLKATEGLTTEAINEYPEIQSYRKMYKQMGVDWHSKRPSPEALLRRIATGKGLYNPINVCVDAYNLIVMKNRVSSGAFNSDQIKFPCEVKIAQGGEKAIFIGDKEPTILEKGEVCYFDQIGPFNMDYNYRDAVRSLVTKQTKNLWINIDGVYDISPEMILKTLKESIDIIIKYCGGQVIEKGILVANDQT